MDRFNTSNQSQMTLTPEQMQDLVSKLSPEDKQRVGEILRSCSGEIVLKRGVPLALVIIGGMHWMRDKLPKSLQAGPSRWIFAAMLGTGCMAISNILFANPCLERITPLMIELNQKYNNPNYAASGSASRYNQIRMANRQSNAANYDIPPPSASLASSLGSRQLYDDTQADQSTESDLREQLSASDQLQNRFKNYEDSTKYVMSGTPIRSNLQTDSDAVRLSADASGAKTKYGDVDFS